MIQAETLELLEWQRLCQHLATFATTKLGAVASRHLQIPNTPQETLTLLAQTQEAYFLELQLANGLSLDGIQDIGVALERVERQGILFGEELLAVAYTLAGARQLRRVIDAQEGIPILTQLVSELRTYPELEQEIHRCIDDRGDVADRASPNLGEIRGKLSQVRRQIQQILQRILQRQANAISQQLVTQRGDRFVIPVKAGQKDAVPGIVHDTSTSGATLYIEPKSTIELNNQLRQLRRKEQTAEEAVRRKLSEKIEEVRLDLERLLAIATTIDLAIAKARYSLWLEANPPKFTNIQTDTSSPTLIQNAEPRTFLRQLRHPLLVWQYQHEQGVSVIPIDVNVNPPRRVVAITGPNTGGKTVTLKTMGLAALMAKVGLFIPAREPVELPWFEQILADIGDEQSIEQSLSTFSGHIRRISRILDTLQPGAETPVSAVESEDQDNLELETLNSTPNPQPSNTLVLLDEVGAGTDPSEGSALAIALLQYLASNTLLTVATTHFGELKALKYQDERFENASVEFDEKSLQPTYRLLWGIPGRSNALTIAKRLGLNPDVIELAASFVGGASEDVNEVIAGLEAQRRQQETKASEAGVLLQQTERLHQELSQRAAMLKQREQELKQAQEQQVQETLLAAKQEIAQVIRQLQKGKPTAQDAQKATEALNQIAERRLPAPKPKQPPKPSFLPQVGDKIRIPSIGQTAEVLTPPNEDGEFAVRFGIMKMTVSLADIESLQGEKPELPPKKTTQSQKNKKTEKPEKKPVIRTEKNTLDLRGKRVSESEIEIDRALSQLIDFGALWIIHGKGTGQLRKGVHEFLKTHPIVERFELAAQAEGGMGVTVAYLK
ncbi:MAG: endonuclease MutS2 [Microcoleaceae cyanobacterium]